MIGLLKIMPTRLGDWAMRQSLGLTRRKMLTPPRTTATA